MIYIFTSPSGKRYIGQTISSIQYRIWKHESDARLSRGAVFQKAIRRYGLNRFSLVTIMGVPFSLLDDWEKFFIKELNTVFPCGYNMDEGGGQKGHPCEASRAKMRLAHAGQSSWNKGIPNTEVQKKRISDALKGRIISEKTREACRRTGLSRKGTDPWNKGKRGVQVGWNKGGHFSEETRKKMSIAAQRRRQKGG